jgi:MATE family multidrug resistance protein
LFTLAVGLVYLLWPQTLTGLFAGEQDAGSWTEIAAEVPVLLRFIVLYMLFDTANLVFSFALRGAGDSRFVTVTAVALAWPIMVLPTLAALALGWSLYAGWSFASLYIMSLALVFLWRFRRGRWRSLRVIETDYSMSPS